MENISKKNIKVFGPLGFTPRLTPQQLHSLNDPSESGFAALPATEEFVDNGHYQFGTPQHLIDEIGKLQDTYPGLDTVTVQPVIPLPKSQIIRADDVVRRGGAAGIRERVVVLNRTLLHASKSMLCEIGFHETPAGDLPGDSIHSRAVPPES